MSIYFTHSQTSLFGSDSVNRSVARVSGHTIAPINFLTIKPTMYIANVAEDGFENNPLLDRVREIAAAEDAVVVPVCAAIESELSELEDEDKLEFMADLGLEEPGLNLVIRGGYELLHLQTYFTAGVKEVRLVFR